MVWGRTSDRDEHRKRSDAPTGSRGGAPIWVMAEAFMPRNSKYAPERQPYRDALAGGHAKGFPDGQNGTDPDGFAVFGRYPNGFLDHVLATELLGVNRAQRDNILHVCSGTLGPEEAWTVDVREEARPRVVASGDALPFGDACFQAVMMDPPYSDQYARNLYRTGMPRNSWLLREAARVVVPGGRIGILHVAVPFSPPGCRLVKVYGVSTGVGFRIRAFTVYEREQAGLFL